MKLGIIGLSAVVAAAIGVAGCGGQADGGCWYTFPNYNGFEFQLPRCDGAQANQVRAAMVDGLGMIPGNKPANAREICQVRYRSNFWVSIWADSADSWAMAGARGACQATDPGAVRWSNFR